MPERNIRVHLWEDRAAITDTVVGQPTCKVFLYWIEPVGQEFLLCGAMEQRKVQEACRFSGLDPNTTMMSVSERHFSKKLLALWMASYLKNKAMLLARYYRDRGDVVHKIVEKHVPLDSEL
jgi:hypothetical protein